MNWKKAASLIIAFLSPFTEATAGEYPDVQREMCGPAKAIHSYLEQSGFYEEVALAFLTKDGVYLTYLPVLDRVRSMKEKSGDYFLGVEIIRVLHTDWTPDHPENWRCIASVLFIPNSRRESLTRYMHKVDEIVQ